MLGVVEPVLRFRVLLLMSRVSRPNVVRVALYEYLLIWSAICLPSVSTYFVHAR